MARRNYSSLQTPHFRVKRYFFIIEPGSRSNFAFNASFTSLNVAKVTIKVFFILCFFDYPIFDIPSFTVEVDADLGYWLAA